VYLLSEPDPEAIGSVSSIKGEFISVVDIFSCSSCLRSSISLENIEIFYYLDAIPAML
jgi:hypothetical protein